MLIPAITGPTYGINILPTNAAFLATLPMTLFYSISSESKKSYLFQAEPSVVSTFILFKTLRPYTSLPSSFS
jgi:hypothetical protein